MWILFYVLLAVTGLAVLTGCGLRVFVEVRKLGHEVDRTARELEPSLVALQQATSDGHDPNTGGLPERRPAAYDRGETVTATEDHHA